jgi:hypothetical protein
MEQIIKPGSGAREYTFVRRSMGKGCKGGQVPGVLWRDQEGFLHWVPDV